MSEQHPKDILTGHGDETGGVHEETYQLSLLRWLILIGVEGDSGNPPRANIVESRGIPMNEVIPTLRATLEQLDSLDELPPPMSVQYLVREEDLPLL